MPISWYVVALSIFQSIFVAFLGVDIIDVFCLSICKEAKNAFKALLESAHVGSDWTWDQVVFSLLKSFFIFLNLSF